MPLDAVNNHNNSHQRQIIKSYTRDHTVTGKTKYEKKPYLLITHGIVISSVGIHDFLYPIIANLDSHLDDAENLGRTGILIFVSDNSAGIGQRMNTIEKDGRFGRAEYSATPSTWEAEKDVYLYFFRQPIIDRSSLSDISQKDMDKMYLKTKEFPKHYFVLYFNPYDWEEYKSELFQYEFFKKAMIIKL